MAYALIDSIGAATLNGSSVLSTVTTAAMDTSGANLIVIGVHGNISVGAVPPTDNKGNTYTVIIAEDGSSVSCVAAFYCLAPVVGSGHTFTHTSTGGALFQSITVSAWSGAAASGVVVASNSARNTSATSLNSGTVTPVSDNCLVVSVLAWKDGTASVSGGALSKIEEVPYSSGNVVGGAMAYEIQTTATARSAAWSWGVSSTTQAAAIVVFDAALVVAPTVTATSILGEDATVAGLSRVHFTNLDGVTRTLSDVAYEGAWVIGGVLTFFELAGPPAGVTNTARIWAEDNGSGKTRLVFQGPTGAAQVIATEP